MDYCDEATEADTEDSIENSGSEAATNVNYDDDDGMLDMMMKIMMETMVIKMISEMMMISPSPSQLTVSRNPSHVHQYMDCSGRDFNPLM